MSRHDHLLPTPIMIVTAPGARPRETEIRSGDFWPPIDPSEIRKDQRIDDTVTAERLRAALIEAIATANAALCDWRLAQETLGTKALTDIEADRIDNTSVLIHRYQRAVGCLAKALLLERLRDFDATGKGERKADFLTDPIDDCRRDYHNAIADIAGRGRYTIELI